MLTAAAMNTHLRDNMLDLDRRSTATGAVVATNQTTATTSYTDLATVGPAATVTIGAAGKALVSIYCACGNTGANPSFMGFAISGASTVAASDSQSIVLVAASSSQVIRFGCTFLVPGLASGSTTFTAKYKAGAGTGSWSDRSIVVTPSSS